MSVLFGPKRARNGDTRNGDTRDSECPAPSCQSMLTYPNRDGSCWADATVTAFFYPRSIRKMIEDKLNHIKHKSSIDKSAAQIVQDFTQNPLKYESSAISVSPAREFINLIQVSKNEEPNTRGGNLDIATQCILTYFHDLGISMTIFQRVLVENSAFQSMLSYEPVLSNIVVMVGTNFSVGMKEEIPQYFQINKTSGYKLRSCVLALESASHAFCVAN